MAELSYIICTAPRTGSTLLSEGLKSTGRAGRPSEFFDIHDYNEQYWVRELGIRSDSEYVRKVIEAGTTPNGVFGLKLHWHQGRALRAKLLCAVNGTAEGHETASMDALIRGQFGEPRYLWLRRRNKIAQGISYFRASKTGIWRAFKGNTNRSNAIDQALQFDFPAIDHHVRLVEEFDRRWEAYLRQFRLKALVLVYEEFVKTYEPTIGAVLDYLNIPRRDAPIVDARLERQSDERSHEWEERYAEMRRAQTTVALPPRGEPGAAAAPPKAMSAATIKRAASPGAEDAPLPLIAYALGPNVGISLASAPSNREWMDATPRRFAYRCLPMLIANQAGWLIVNPHKISVTWNGGPGLEAMKIQYFEEPPIRHAASHFGSGVLTFTVGYLFRTPPGYNLYVRGPANMPKDGIQALEGIVETDWSEATFTMNWLITRRNHPIVFEAGEPIAMVSPMRRGEIERFRPEIHSIAESPELRAGYEVWMRSRQQHNADLKVPNSDAQKRGWQRHYMHGTTVTDQVAPEHQTGLALEPFVDKRG